MKRKTKQLELVRAATCACGAPSTDDAKVLRLLNDQRARLEESVTARIMARLPVDDLEPLVKALEVLPCRGCFWEARAAMFEAKAEHRDNENRKLIAAEHWERGSRQALGGRLVRELLALLHVADEEQREATLLKLARVATCLEKDERLNTDAVWSQWFGMRAKP